MGKGKNQGRGSVLEDWRICVLSKIVELMERGYKYRRGKKREN